MHVRLALFFIAAFFIAAPARGQESVRELTGAGKVGKFLTPGQLDRWIFEGEKGETIIAHISSREFDPVLELARPGEKDEDKVLLEVDDAGSESRFSFRLPEKGQYKIRVHGFKYQGGGNYTLEVRRFQAEPLTVGKPIVGTFDRAGKAFHYFPGAKDQILIPHLRGAASGGWNFLDFKGRELRDWADTLRIAEVGENSLIVSGQPGSRYDLVVREARRHDLVDGKDPVGPLQQGEMDVLSFQGKPGDFRVLEVDKKGEVQTRLIFAPAETKAEQRIAGAGDRPEIAFLPVASRGGRVRYAVVLGRTGRYQLQLLAGTPASYTVKARDPSVPIARGKAVEGTLPVGGAAFYSFKALPGQILQASLASQKFVPALSLYDEHGVLVAGSSDDSDGTNGLEGRLTHTVVSEGLYRFQVSSFGDGGGGEFRLGLTETKPKELQIGGRGQGTVRPGETEFWAFDGKDGQTVFLSVRSTILDPVVSVRSPDGVLLSADDRGGPATGSLLALKLPKTGRYTVWVSSRRGAGEYKVRLIDAD